MEIPAKFEVVHNGKVLQVESVMAGNTTLFRVGLAETPVLMITRATKENGKKFWTSLPEGRQAEAEAIGPLIEAWYNSNH